MSQDPELDKQPQPTPDGDEDTEGHSLAIIAGVNAMSRGRQDTKPGKAKDEDLKPLTKPFPSLRDESRK